MGSFIPGQDTHDADLDVDTDLHVAPLPPRDVLLSVRTGKSRRFGQANFRTAINKHARQGRLQVTGLGLDGDEQTYEHHGGVDKALHHYCSAHYKTWNDQLPDRQHLFKIGGFGENFSTAHMSEDNVCIGDVYRIGPVVVVQVSQPREPCYKLNHRFEHKKTSIMAQSSGRTGWYYRVLVPGQVEEGDEIELVERLHPRWSLSKVQHYLYHDRNNLTAMAELIELAELAAEMREVFRSRLSYGTEDMSGRLDDRAPVTWRSYVLSAKVPLTPRISKFIFEIQPADNDDTDDNDSQFARFQHVRLRFGTDLAFTRAYSVVSGDMRSFELGIARDDNSRGGSVYLHDKLKVGDVVKVAKGHAPASASAYALEPAERLKHVFVIGGIGITAFLTEISKLYRQGSRIEVHYAVRTRADAAYLNQLPTECTTVYAKSENRRLDIAQIIPGPQSDGRLECVVYCCGPPSLLESCRNQTRALGYPASNVHFEEFGGATTGTGEPFEVEIRSTKQVLEVPREKSLLEVLVAAGFEIDSSCLVGNCGTCMVDYCKGEVLHQGTALEEGQKADSMLTCVSRGKGRVALDC